jgi:eukaryotic-like serine/threonine-protein kinase
MEVLDAAAMADRTARLSLLRPDQIDEAWLEVARKDDAATFLRAMERKGYLTPFQTQKLSKGETDGYVLGGYKLLYKIASGSFGRVFRAEEPGTGRIVAVKILRKKWSENKHTVELFEREGRVGVTLVHSNIVQILAINQDPVTKQYYMVLEFVEGGNLRDILKIRKKMEPAEAMKLLEECISGLAFAFSKGLTHRDLKTTNVMLSTGGVAKLVDFGLADVVDQNAKPAKEDEEVDVDRTVDYAGLEKATGAPHGDTRSDIFFMGCIGYQLLTGRSPLEWSRDSRARMNANRFLNIPSMRPDELTAPPSVFRVIDTMMKLNPNERFQTPAQCLEAIRVARRDLEGGDGKRVGPFTVFISEKNPSLQDVLRDKLKDKGFKVLIAGDPQRAVERFRQNPFDAFIVNGASTGDPGISAFREIKRDAVRQKIPLGIVLLLTQDQAESLGAEFDGDTQVAVLVHPVKFKELVRTLNGALGVE